MATDHRLRRFVVLALVACIHALLLTQDWSVVRKQPREADSGQRLTVLFFPENAKRIPKPIDIRSVEPHVDIDVSIPEALPTAAGEAPAAPPHDTRPIDWNEEARRVAAARVEKSPSPKKRQCNPGDATNPLLPECKPPPQDFKWAPPRAGFDHGLPYVRVGEKCVVALGFFGCAFGEVPADGRLFEHMRDPERDRSSVPESR